MCFFFFLSGLVAISGVIYLYVGCVKELIRTHAKNHICLLLRHADVQVGRDIQVHDEGIWMRWLATGMLGIGETYTEGGWSVCAGTSLDQVLHKLMMLAPEKKKKSAR